MKIQPINSFACSVKQSSSSKQTKTNNVSFNGYGEVMGHALSTPLHDCADVSKQVQQLFFSLMKENGVIKKPIFNTVQDWISIKSTYFVKELCKPLAEITPSLRNIVIDSKEKNISVLEGYGNNEAYIINFGKHGFWNSVFENESARNDMRLVFSSEIGTFELGTSKDGKLVAEQSYRTGSWKKSIFNPNTGKRVDYKSGDASDPIIWPAY